MIMLILLVLGLNRVQAQKTKTVRERFTAFLKDASMNADSGDFDVTSLAQDHFDEMAEELRLVPPSAQRLRSHLQDTTSDLYLAYQDQDVAQFAPLLQTHVREYLEGTGAYPPVLLDLALGQLNPV